MSLESKNLRCPYCGGEIHRSINQGGIENHVCKSCRHEFFVEQGYSLETLFCLNSFRNEVINLLYAKIAGGKNKESNPGKTIKNVLKNTYNNVVASLIKTPCLQSPEPHTLRMDLNTIPPLRQRKLQNLCF